MNMKKVVNVFEEKAEGLDTNKRITSFEVALPYMNLTFESSKTVFYEYYRNVSENIRRVDNIVSSARSSSALFSSQALAARARLRDACERAIMTGSTSFTQRMEEVLWRKVYYDPLSASKKLKKGTAWSAVEAGFIWTHLNDGIAYYHQLLSTFACSHKMLNCTADLLPIYYQDDDQMSKTSNNESSLKESFFRSLTCLGDLARYLLDVPPQISDSSAYLLSVRFYHQALHYNCEGGLTHSNLATVYSTNNQPLLAAVHYLRAITCEKPFEAAENNLRRMLDKSRIWLENQKISKDYSKENNFEKESNTFLHTCLALLSCFLGNRRTEEVAVLCQDVLTQMGKLLDDYDNIDPPDLSEASNEGVGAVSIVNGHNGWTDSSEKQKSDSSENKTTKEELGSLFLLTPESMVTLCALFIVCVKRLKMQASPHHSMSEVLLISILLTLVSHINTRLEQRFSLIDPSFIQNLLPPPDQPEKVEEIEKDKEADKNACNGNEEKIGNKKKGKTNKLAKLRRRRIRGADEDSSIGCGEDSDNSGDDEDDGSATSSDEEDNFNASVLCSSEDEDSDEDVKIESDQEWDGITAEEHLQLIEQEGMLAAVNVTFDWLFNDEEIIKLCNKNADTLWTSLAKLFNHIRIDYGKLKSDSSSNIKAEMIEKLLTLEKMASDTPKDKLEKEKGLDMRSLSLPENLMLTVIIPSFKVSNPGQNLKSSDMNLLRLYRLYSIIYNLANRDDTPVKIEGNRFIVSKEKVNIILEPTKTELSEKTADGRTTPSTQSISSSASVHNSPKSGDHNKWDDSLLSTPKRPQPSIGRVTSSMQTLTAQWLQHEVRNLEERTNRRMNLGGLYLVPDASVLINYLPSIKKLLTARSHMVIIPQIVIDSLDQQKRDTVGARDAIRWLEVKLRHGSRFIRAQRPHERTRLPLVKYPKRKEKEAWEWFHLAECCYYLGAQLNNKSNNIKTSTVTLLVGERPIKLTTKHSLSLSTLAEAAGSVLQSADEFIRKWQTSTKGHS